jgi:hypothetical protein
MALRRRLAIGIVGVLVVFALAALLVLRNREQPYDRSFDSGVNEPAYRAGGPTVLYDEGHRNTHTTTSGYKPLAELLRNDGYALRITRQVLTPRELEGIAVLILALAQGANDTNDDPAYSDAEVAAIDAWVRGGGSLLLVTDHWPYGSSVAPLARRFGVEMGAGMVEDTVHHEPERGESHLVFSEENGLLGDHAIIRGRNDAERVRRVLTFTGTSMHGPAAAVPLLRLSAVATERPPGAARAERSGGDLRVFMEYGAPSPAAGRAQGLALAVDKGRVVVLGEAGMLRAQRTRRGDQVGMNVPGYDNRQLALNIMHWLSRAL